MKKSKLSRIAALLAAGALLVGGMFMSCSSGGDDDDDDNGGGASSGVTYETLTDSAVEPTAPETSGTITVTGGASYSGTSIEDAWKAIQSATADVTMTLAAGTYQVSDGTRLTYSGAYNIKISGDSSSDYGTNVLIYGNTGTNSQKSRELLYLDSSSSGSLTLEYVTLRNDFAFTSTSDVQAEVLATDGTGNVAAYHCSFLSGQDTIRTVAKAWFYHCYIEGDVDFLWMETSGTAALYEECVIRAVNNRVTDAYFTAPRMSIQSKAGKGLVIYNSTLQVEDGVTAYLARNPWASSALSSYYNQVAIVNSPLYLGTNASLSSAIWKSASNGTGDLQYVGYKTDDYYPSASNGYGAVLSSSVENAEYCGRKNILNRVYNTASKKFQKDSESEWDIDSVISTNNWTVTTDTSSALLDGESELTTVAYDFSSSSGNGFSSTDLTLTSTKDNGNSLATTATGATITVPITGKCVVYVRGFYSGYGTIQAGIQGVAIYDFNNNNTNTTVEKAYVVYDSSATSVVITASTTTYITEIVVEYDDSVSFTAVTSIDVSSSSSSYTVGIPVTLSATVSPDEATNTDVLWSSSDETVGTIDEYTGKATFVAAGSVTFTATACDGSKVTGTITCSPTESNWTSAEWYSTQDSSSKTDSGSGTSLGVSAGENNSIFTIGTANGVTLGSSKSIELIDGTTASISTGIKMDSGGTVTFSVTKAAKVTVYTGYCSTANATSDTLAITASNGGSATAWSTNPTTAPTADTVYIWTLTSGTYKLARAGSGYAPSIYYVRVDIGEYTEDTGDEDDNSENLLVSATMPTESWGSGSSNSTTVATNVTANGDFNKAYMNYYCVNGAYAGMSYTSTPSAYVSIAATAFADVSSTSVELVIKNAALKGAKPQIAISNGSKILALSDVLSSTATDVTFYLNPSDLTSNGLMIFTVDNTASSSSWSFSGLAAYKSDTALDTTAPEAATGFTATAETEAAELSWTASTSTDVTAYILSYQTGEGTATTAVLASSATSKNVDSLTAGSEYTFTLKAVDVYGNTSETTAKATPTEATDKINAFSSSYVTAVNGGTVTGLTTTGSGTVTYSSSKTNVATVDSSTGALTIVGAGYTTITATVGEATATYVLAVAPKASEAYTWNAGELNTNTTSITADKSGNKTFTTGFYNGLYVDVSSGKFYVRSSDVQINTGVKIYIPVDITEATEGETTTKSTTQTLTINLYNGYNASFKIGTDTTDATATNNAITLTAEQVASYAAKYTLGDTTGYYVLITGSNGQYTANNFVVRTATSN